MLIKIWRKKLHEYDTENADGDQETNDKDDDKEVDDDDNDKDTVLVGNDNPQ